MIYATAAAKPPPPYSILLYHTLHMAKERGGVVYRRGEEGSGSLVNRPTKEGLFLHSPSTSQV